MARDGRCCPTGSVDQTSALPTRRKMMTTVLTKSGNNFTRVMTTTKTLERCSESLASGRQFVKTGNDSLNCAPALKWKDSAGEFVIVWCLKGMLV